MRSDEANAIRILGRWCWFVFVLEPIQRREDEDHCPAAARSLHRLASGASRANARDLRTPTRQVWIVNAAIPLPLEGKKKGGAERGLTWMWCVSERTAGKTTPVMDAPSRKANLQCGTGGQVRGSLSHHCGANQIVRKRTPTHSACHFCSPFVPSEAEPMRLRTNTAGGWSQRVNRMLRPASHNADPWRRRLADQVHVRDCELTTDCEFPRRNSQFASCWLSERSSS